MSVTAQNISRTARLAKLRIDEAEIPQYVKNLNNLLKLADEMSRVNTDGIEPMTHPMEGQTQRFRRDDISEKNQRNLLQAVAPEGTKEGLYIVPKVIE
jgi:aspartyl-tRNA(Asn)/glutamyl-tRNA(Gln) amidotransferase subunit C